jgi:hypothetical protein
MRTEKLVEVRRVTDRFPTGEVRKTEHVEERWVDIDAKLGVIVGDEMLCPLSTDRVEELLHTCKPTMRRVSDDA